MRGAVERSADRSCSASGPESVSGDDRTGPVRIGLFGPLQVRGVSGALDAAAFPGVKPKQLLEVLLCERGHRVSKSRLAEQLWGEALPQDHVATLETYVCVLRRTMRRTGTAHRSIVVTETGGYRVGPVGVAVDLDEFDRLREQAVGVDPATALTRLRSALGLVRGDVLEDEPYARWAAALRETYRDRQVQTLVDAGRLSLVTGDPSAALELAQRAVELEPLAEPAYQVVMSAAYALWRQDEALAAFDRCRRLLAHELGADPMDETVALHLAILRHEQLADLLPSIGAPGHRPPVPLTPSTAPRPDQETVRGPSGLPWLGREHELSTLQDSVQRVRSGRLTVALVTGCTGIGKTSLVEQLVQQFDGPVAANRCADVEATLPYLALSLALQSLPRAGEDGLPALDPLVDGGARSDELGRLRVMEAFADRVSGRSPFVLWLDDAQWADRETVTTLRYLQRRCPTAPVLVVLTCDRSRATLEALRGLRPDVRLELGPLPRACVDALGDPQLFSVTAGHPMFVGGWLEARRAELPSQFSPGFVERVLMACWDAGPRGYQLLSVAAGLDAGTFRCSTLAALVDVGVPEVVDELEHLVELGLLTWAGQELAFGTPALRSILSAALSPARRSFVRQQAEALDGALGDSAA